MKQVFPASAGVILYYIIDDEDEQGFPRIRGGDPASSQDPCIKRLFSPHPRG